MESPFIERETNKKCDSLLRRCKELENIHRESNVNGKEKQHIFQTTRVWF